MPSLLSCPCRESCAPSFPASCLVRRRVTRPRLADSTMLTEIPSARPVRRTGFLTPGRRALLNGSMGLTGLSVATLLLAPKVVALAAGSLEVLGTGVVANLALVFGSLMFLREAQRTRAAAKPQPDDATRPPASPGNLR